MKTFLVISLLGFGLIGCASSPYNSQENYLNKPLIVPENKLLIVLKHLNMGFSLIEMSII